MNNKIPVKLIPALKDYLWGGDRLKKDYGIESDLPIVAEAWVLSCHPDGPSVVANGEYAGLTLPQMIEKAGTDILGTRGKSFEFFPILVKLIDAKGNLSIQVHPSDEYALKNEGQYGKTEMWYVVDCDKDAYLYYGFDHKISREEFKERIENDTLLEVLNRVPVKKGDCFFIESGTIHAIAKGLLIAEIQQNSNLTYRVYDYGRRDKNGNPRELHVEKAMKVTTLDRPQIPYGQPKSDRLAQCKYFTVDRIRLDGEREITVDDESFLSLLCLEGSAEIGCVSFKKGESVFLPASMGKLTLKGHALLISSRV